MKQVMGFEPPHSSVNEVIMKLWRESEYVKKHGDKLSQVVKCLCVAFESLPGVKVGCVGQEKQGEIFHIWLDIFTKKGAMFLGRVLDRRYSPSHDHFRIILDNSDVNEKHIVMRFETINPLSEETYKEFNEFIDVMNQHLNHPAYISSFMGDLIGFKYV